MTRLLLFAYVVFLFATAWGCTDGSNKPAKYKGEMPPEAEKALQEATEIELLSLHPYRSKGEPAPPDSLNGFKILGTTTIKDNATKAKLITEFKAGVTEHNGIVEHCFNPRHAIKVSYDGQQYVFVICFECSQVAWSIDSQQKVTFLISGSPQTTFDEILKKSKCTVAGLIAVAAKNACFIRTELSATRTETVRNRS